MNLILPRLVPIFILCQFLSCWVRGTLFINKNIKSIKQSLWRSFSKDKRGVCIQKYKKHPNFAYYISVRLHVLVGFDGKAQYMIVIIIEDSYALKTFYFGTSWKNRNWYNSCLLLGVAYMQNNEKGGGLLSQRLSNKCIIITE